jgi:DNA-binding NarL/FixJ family response regulator
MGDTAQIGSASSMSWPAVERRRPVGGGFSPGRTEVSDVQDHENHGRGLSAAPHPRVATILIGQNGLFLEGLKHILDKTDFDVLAVQSTAEQLHLAQHQTTLLVVDAAREAQTTIRQVELFKQRRPDAFVVVLIDTDRMTEITLLFQAGANACVARGISSSVFLKSLELVMLGETLLPSGVLSSLCSRAQAPAVGAPVDSAPARLSAQEERILGHLVQGHPNKAIARELGITDATVKVHVKAILRKIGAQNRTQAAIWATRHGGHDGAARKDAAPNGAALKSEPGLSLPTMDGVSGASVATDDKPFMVAISHQEMPSEECAKAAAPAGAEYGPKVTTQASFLREANARRAARRIAEDEERHDALVAKMNHLRGLREARNLQVG